MYKKIIGIFVCMLLISTTVLSMAGNVKVISTTDNQTNSTSPRLVEMPNFYEQFSKEAFINKLGKTSDRAFQDWITKTQQTNDGGYIAFGITETYGHGGKDFWLIKTDSSGDEEWNKTFGGPYEDAALGGQQTSDGGYIITGFTTSLGGGGTDLWLIKTDSNGIEEWNKIFGFGGWIYEWAMFVQQTSDDGYIVTGCTMSYGAGGFDLWLIKTDSSGNEQWNKTFGGIYNDYGFVVRQIEDGYIITGGTDSFGTYGIHYAWLIKTDSDGNELWNKTFGGKKNDMGHDVWPTTDGGYILLGYTNTYAYENNSRDFYLIKTDENGNEQWNRTYDGSDIVSWVEVPGYSSGMCVRQISDGGYVLLGTTDASYGPGPICVKLMKVDNSGNELWNQTYGGDSYDEGYWFNETSDGGYILCGSTRSFGTSTSDGWLIKTDSLGNEIWNNTFPEDQPPYIPSDPEPWDGEIEVDVNVDLSWYCNDPEGDLVKYDVYFGKTSPPPLVVSKKTGRSYDPGVLDFDTEYFWQIVAWDFPGGESTIGPIWNFTTEEDLRPEGKIESEDFEKDKMPPYGWQHHVNSNNTWDVKEGGFYAHSGSFGAVCHAGPMGEPQDEWLISSVMNFSSMDNIVLSFWWKSDYDKMVEQDNFDVFVKVSVDNGSSWDTVWTSGDIGDFTSWEWYNTSLGVAISLDDYEDKSSVLVAWQFYGENTSDFIIDEILIVGIKKVPVLNLENIKGGLGKIKGDLENSGDVSPESIGWKTEIVLPDGGFLRQLFRGLLFIPKQKEWETTYTDFKMNMFGLGRATVNISYIYTVLNTSEYVVDVEGFRQLDVRGLFVFLNIIEQPSRPWVKIESQNVVYEEDQGPPVNKFVKLYYGVKNMHIVRVVDADSSDILFQGACCFDGEVGVLSEGFITKGIVKSDNAYWEVELKEGEYKSY